MVNQALTQKICNFESCVGELKSVEHSFSRLPGMEQEEKEEIVRIINKNSNLNNFFITH